MTRIETASSGQEREELKKEIKEELRHEATRKRLFGCGACSLLMLIIFGTPLLWGASMLAKTGFFDVPVLSKAQYKPSTPVRTVIPLVGSSPDDILHAMAARATYEPATGHVTLRLSEEELTTLALHGVNNAPQGLIPFPVRAIQIAVEEHEVEVYLVSPQKDRDATVRLRFLPFVKKGKLDFEVHEMLVGGLTVPRSLTQAVFTVLAKPAFDAALDNVTASARLVDIKLEQKTMRFIIIPTRQ